jgi:lactoylglutathione lyase
MLALWSISTAPIGLTLHVAFEVEKINDLLDAPKRLKDQGIMSLPFFGIESMEPSVIGWMPAAAIYLRSGWPHDGVPDNVR